MPDSGTIAARLLWLTVGLAIATAGVVTLGGIVNHFAFDDGIPDLDAGREGSLNNWVPVVVSFSGALAAALHAFFVAARRVAFGVLAALFAFLSLDDQVQLHERVAENLDGRLEALPRAIADHFETVIFAPIFGLTLVVGWAIARGVPARLGRTLRVGLILLVAAVVVDLGSTITRDLAREGTAWPQATRIAFEEGLEVSGWILASAALVTILCLALLERDEPGR